MRFFLARFHKLLILTLLGMWGCFCLIKPSICMAAEALLKNGHRIQFYRTPVPAQGLTLNAIKQGNRGPVMVYPYTMLNAETRRYYVAQSQIEEIQLGDPNVDEFELKLPASPRTLTLQSVGRFVNVGPFSEQGRRIVSLLTPKGNLNIVQSITQIRPDFTTLAATNVRWEYAIETRTLESKTLLSALAQSIDFFNADDRLAVIRFFIDCQRYQEAHEQLDRLRTDFPDLVARLNDLDLQIRQLRALERLNELKRRQESGQHELVYRETRVFPRRDVNLTVLEDIDDLIQGYESSLNQMDLTQAKLSEYQAMVDSEKASYFRDMRSVVSEELSHDNIERLIPFLRVVDDDFLKPEEKLALAYSSWVVGPARATTSAREAISFWTARDYVAEYLRTENPIQLDVLLTQLSSVESVGPETIAAILKHLPAIIETPHQTPGEPFVVTPWTARDNESQTYSVLLPPEYQPSRKYPTILVFPREGMSAEQELIWWGGTTIAGPAQRQGYIVIAPHVDEESRTDYWSRTEFHRDMALMLRDARLRFSMDSNRLFVVGHGSGGTAVYDFAFSHPDWFAGAVAFNAPPADHVLFYQENTKRLPLYLVCGELDGELYEQNANFIGRNMKRYHDVILTQYRERGREDYFEEVAPIFEWMNTLERAPLPKEFEARTMRESDHRFAWLDFSGLPVQIVNPKLIGGRIAAPKSMPISGKITPGNTIQVKAGVERLTLWLTPELVDFEKRLKVTVLGRKRDRFNDFPERDVAAMLDHVRMTGDRDRLYWMRIDF